MGFVTAFRGRRDGYQLPIALAEGSLLDCFLTDHFYGPIESVAARLLPARSAEKLRLRGDPRIAPELVKRMRGIALAEAVMSASGGAAGDLYARYDPRYGEAAADTARRLRSDLFLYSAYAPQAFSARYAHEPKKILFQYHPHFKLESGLLQADLPSLARYGLERTEEIDGGLAPDDVRIQSDESWRLADHIVCASNFTKRSLVEVGADPKMISVVPYGVDLTDAPSFAPPSEFHALYVGSGTYRKGLHHLISAWQKARLGNSARLTVVARKIEPGLLRLVQTARGVDYLPGVGTGELQRLYETASLFVMPSLVEGFGQVYLEALSHGLPVLGTANTCVPDLGMPDEGLFLVPPGDDEALAAKLEQLAELLHGNEDIRRKARMVAARHDWESFRRGVRAVAIR